MKPLLVLGDSLLDRDVEGRVTRQCPDAPAPVLDESASRHRPGGAALAAALAAADGREVTLVTALAADAAGRELARLLDSCDVRVIDIGLPGATPEKVRLRDRGRTLVRLDRGGSSARPGPLNAAARAAIGWAEAILVADYGRGMAAQPTVRELLGAAAAEKAVAWDPHPRGCEPVAGVALATPNLQEARHFAAMSSPNGRRPAAAACAPEAEILGARLTGQWGARGVCVTCGAQGAVLCAQGSALRIGTRPAPGGDSCGAGDRFASAAAGALADGAALPDAVREGVRRASEFVARGAAGAWSADAREVPDGPPWSAPVHGQADEARALIARTRATGGTVVATGGCFDLLHVGHIRTLQAARRLGDCLLVCLNSDASVFRLKGPGRPLVGEQDRARLLGALACVDAVVSFEEDTPERLLAQLKPDVWAKGGDYDPASLAERTTVEASGGRVVTLPYLDGHSTSRLLQEVAQRGAG